MDSINNETEAKKISSDDKQRNKKYDHDHQTCPGWKFLLKNVF